MKMLCFMTCINAFWGSKTDDINWHNTVPFVPPVTSGNVIKVYDGDTITIASKLPMFKSPIYRFPVRLTGIDSPEIKGKSEAEMTLAKQSREALSELIFGKNVKLENVSTEKYGRLLADVYIDGIHVNQWMLDNKYAIPYGGGTKTRPIEWN
ncbi:MAG: thermonuclease family protein [Flavobacterium sp.]